MSRRISESAGFSRTNWSSPVVRLLAALAANAEQPRRQHHDDDRACERHCRVPSGRARCGVPSTRALRAGVPEWRRPQDVRATADPRTRTPAERSRDGGKCLLVFEMGDAGEKAAVVRAMEASGETLSVRIRLLSLRIRSMERRYNPRASVRCARAGHPRSGMATTTPLLIVVAGPARGRSAPIAGSLSIGRDQENVLPIADPALSRHHCVIDTDRRSRPPRSRQQERRLRQRAARCASARWPTAIRFASATRRCW